MELVPTKTCPKIKDPCRHSDIVSIFCENKSWNFFYDYVNLQKHDIMWRTVCVVEILMLDANPLC